jgi:hypothetical protein
MSTERERRFVGPRRGQLVFALGFLAVSALLLSLIGDQTRWAEDTRLFAQPRFWPGVAIGAMVGLGGLHLAGLPWRRLTRFDGVEARKWLRVLEYAGWFMAYVLVVPVVGYLPATLVFVPLLTWRMGYRAPRMLWIAAGFAWWWWCCSRACLRSRSPAARSTRFCRAACAASSS